MLNFIIYEDNKNYMQKNISGVNIALANYDIDYRIHKFDSYSQKLDDIIHDKDMKKIYILDVEMRDVSGLEVAARIRENDWDSIIIFATAYDKYHNDVFYNRLMVLDFIYKYDGYEDRLIDDVKASLKIIYRENTFTFKFNRVLYRIPFEHITYIEKEPIVKRCIIHTVNGDYNIMRSIHWLSENLGPSFIRTHQSCVVNANNIEEVELGTNTIYFKNGDSTSLMTERTKRELKAYVGIDK